MKKQRGNKRRKEKNSGVKGLNNAGSRKKVYEMSDSTAQMKFSGKVEKDLGGAYYTVGA